jgi:hypothetical protein
MAGITGVLPVVAKAFLVTSGKSIAPAANPAPVRKNERRLIVLFSICFISISLFLNVSKIVFSFTC